MTDSVSPKKRRKKKPLKKQIRQRLISGLLVVVPLGLTVYILRFLYDLTAGRLAPFTRPLFGPPFPDYVIPALSVLFLAIVTYGVGLVASAVAGRTLIGLAEAVLERIPLVKTIYGASKQVVQTLSFSDEGNDFKSVVLIDFPRPGMKVFALVTGKILLKNAHDGTVSACYKLFAPTTPNPTSGYLEFVPEDMVETLDISVEDAIKMLMSGGLVMPEIIGRPPGIMPPVGAAYDNEVPQ